MPKRVYPEDEVREKLCIYIKMWTKNFHSLTQFMEKREKVAQPSAEERDYKGHMTACGVCAVFTWALFSQMLTGRRMKEVVSLKQSLLMSHLTNHCKAKLDE